MAITDEDLKISNTSYVNKDFSTIYSEVLESANKLSNRWKPSTSNESDPGIVLLKEGAFIGDKLSYNTDKNILEGFLPSATQENPVRDLCEINGYNVQYYKAATTDVSFMYKGDFDSKKIKLEALNTIISDEDDNVSYILLEDITLDTQYATESKECMEGTLHTMTVGDSEIIYLSNLDDNNRIYFSDTHVASNGVFIKINDGSEGKDSYWDVVDNLNIQEPGSYVFKVGYDSAKGLPYIEFPNDISSLIENGLSIKYITTSGVDGNISAGVLNTLKNPTSVNFEDTETAIDLDSLTISNLSASSNGANPESIDEAYSNYKKTVGTFETLTTCRDYANAIYTYELDSKPLVGNVHVEDRRTDYNYANNIVTFTDYGKEIVDNVSSSDITPYNLCIYPLNPISTSYTLQSYKNSFMPMPDDSAKYVVMTGYLNDTKNICHTYKKLQGTDVFCFKNYYKLNAQISTNYKVTEAEANTILSNVNTALYKNFNSKEVDFGYEIPYDTIVEVMQNADSRIKNVSLDDPEIYTKVRLVDAGSEELDLNTNNSDIELAAKNVLAGKLPLFEYNNDFNYEYGESNINTNGKNLKKITTLTNIILESGESDEYTLRANEVIQLIAPNFTTDITYPYTINYVYEGDTIKADSEYELKENEHILFTWTDSNNQSQSKYYGKGQIIKPNFELSEGSGMLGSDQQIEHRTLVQTILNTYTPCYWIRNNSNNALFTSSEIEGDEVITILGENEFFIYTNSSMTELAVLGSGTKLSIPSENFDPDDWIIDGDLLDIEDINDNGLAAFATYNWQYKDFSKGNLTITELQLLTLVEGDKIKSTIKYELDNDFQDVDESGEITYWIDDEKATLPHSTVSGCGWKIKSRLDLNAGPALFQTLESGQSITYYTEAGESGTFNSKKIKFNTLIQRAGGENIDLEVLYLDGTRGYDVSMINFEYEVPKYSISSGLKPIQVLNDGYINLPLSEMIPSQESGKYGLLINLPVANINTNPQDYGYKTNLLMVYYSIDESESGVVLSNHSIRVTENEGIRLYNSYDESGVEPWTNIVYLSPGINVIEYKVDNIKVYIDSVIESGQPVSSVVLSKINITNGINSNLGITDADKSKTLLQIINERAGDLTTGNNLFYYNCPIDSSTYIETLDLNTPEALWNYNNVANRITIPQIDFANSNIDIVKNSRRS